MLSGDLTVSEALGINVDIGAGSASTLTKAIGINVKSFTKSTGSIGTAYGLYLEEQTNGATNYQVYSPAGNWDLGTGDITTTGDIHNKADNAKHYFGASDDASIYYNGSDLIINPKEVGSGSVNIDGDLNVTGEVSLGDNVSIHRDLNVTEDIYSNYIYSKNQVSQFHRVATATAASADTWYNITFDLEIDDETISDWYNLTDSNSSITINGFEGIIRVQGCIHPYNDDVGNQEASFYARVLVNGIEARCFREQIVKVSNQTE